MPPHPVAPLPAVPRIAPTRARAIIILVAVFTFFFSAYVFSSSADYFSTGDTTIRIEVAENILGRWSIDLHGWKLQYPHHIKKEFLDPRVQVGRQSRVYSTYLLGQPLLIIPFDKVASILAVHERWPYGPAILLLDRMVGPLSGAIEILIFFAFAVRLGYGVARALILTLIFGFASMAWPDALSVLEHTIVAASILLAMYCAFRFREQAVSWLYVVGSGAALGGAAITRYQDAFLGALAVGLYLGLPGGPGPDIRTRAGIVTRIQRLLLFGTGIAPFIAVDLWYAWARFGSPFASGHHETVFGYTIWKGALGLLVSPGKGLVWYCPILFLLLLAGPRFARRFGTLAISIGALFACFVLLYGYVTYWHGDPAWGPRYIYPTVPLLVLPLGELLCWRGNRRRTVALITAGVVFASFGVQFAAVSVSPWRSWYRVISYEEQHGHKWQWIASRYNYHWTPQESPLYFQLHGLYQLAYDGLFQSSRYELVPPSEDPILDSLTVDYAINQWNFWWKSNEFDWWIGQQKIVATVVFLVALMAASGTYLTAEATGLFAETRVGVRPDLVTEAA